jgi:hypothetical protein
MAPAIEFGDHVGRGQSGADDQHRRFPPDPGKRGRGVRIGDESRRFRQRGQRGGNIGQRMRRRQDDNVGGDRPAGGVHGPTPAIRFTCDMCGETADVAHRARAEPGRQVLGDVTAEHAPARIDVAILPDGVRVALEFAIAAQPARKVLRVVRSHAHSCRRDIDPVRWLLAGIGKAAAEPRSRLDHGNRQALRLRCLRQVPGNRSAGKAAADYGDAQPADRRERVHEALASDFGR